jgi:hypothetical protein
VFEVAVAYLVYAIYAVIALVGLICIAVGVVAHRRGHGGRALKIIGGVVVLLPMTMVAVSYLPGQQ